MANGSEVLLGSLLGMKILANKSNKQNIIVLNVFLRRTLHNVLWGMLKWQRTGCLELDLGIIYNSKMKVCEDVSL